MNKSHLASHHRSFLLFILTSLSIHGAGLFIWLWLQRSPSTTQRERLMPIEFVEVPAETATKKPPPKTQRQATHNSVARGKINPKLPPATDKIAETPSQIAPPPEPKTSTSSQPTKPPPAKPTKPPAKPQTNANALTSEPSSQQIKPSPDVATNSPAPTATAPTSTKPKSVPANPSSGASLLGGSYQRSFADDAGSSFALQANASQEAQNFSGLDARQNLDMSNYFDEIRRRVKRNWNPEVANDERLTVLTFSIQQDGSITGLKIASSSGSELVDRESLAAVRQSAPFDALPSSYPRNSLDIQFNFNIYIYR